MGISEGKITLYTAAAGVNPMQVCAVHRLLSDGANSSSAGQSAVVQVCRAAKQLRSSCRKVLRNQNFKMSSS
jgi:malic enzyme